MASTTPKGLKLLKAESANKGNRQGNWNNPNTKSLKRLEIRLKDWEKCHSNAVHEMHKPGSMKVK